MIHPTFTISSFLTLTFIQFSCGTTANQLTPEVQNEEKCAELDKSEWTINRLKNVQLDTWLWKCLLLRYNNNLDKLVSGSSADLYDAATKGYIGFVQYYIERQGVDQLYVARDEDDQTPLQLAIANGHLDVVKYAVMKSNLTASYFLNMFQEAVYHNQYAIVDYFIHEKTFIPNLHEDEEALLSLAAVRAGNLSMLKYLIEQNGFPADVRDKEFLYQAAEVGDLKMLKYLVEEKFFIVEGSDYDLLYSAALGGKVDVLEYLIDERRVSRKGTSYRGTILHAAAQSGNLKAVRFVVETLNHNVNVTISDGTTPAHVAAATSSPSLRYLIDERDADLNARRNNGDNLLHTAAAAGQLSNAKYLVEQKNMNVELKNLDGMTPLYKAVRRGRLGVVKYLAGQRKAYINDKSIDGKNLLHHAVFGDNVEVMKYLVDDMKMLSRIEEKDDDNRTATMIAAQIDSLKVLKYLVDEKRANTSFMEGSEDGLLWVSTGKISARRLATMKYLIEEKALNFNALPATNPMRYIYLKYFYCRYNDVCQWWDECPVDEICPRWKEYLQKTKTYLDVSGK